MITSVTTELKLILLFNCSYISKQIKYIIHPTASPSISVSTWVQTLISPVHLDSSRVGVDVSVGQLNPAHLTRTFSSIRVSWLSHFDTLSISLECVCWGRGAYQVTANKDLIFLCSHT